MERSFMGWIRIQICIRRICLVGVFSGRNNICTGQRHLNWPIFYLSASSDAKMWNWCFFCDLDTDLFLHTPLHPRLHMSTVLVWSAQVTKCMFVARLVGMFIKYQNTYIKNAETIPCGILIWHDTNVLKCLIYQNFLVYRNFGWYLWYRTSVYLSVCVDCACPCTHASVDIHLCKCAMTCRPKNMWVSSLLRGYWIDYWLYFLFKQIIFVQQWFGTSGNKLCYLYIFTSYLTAM